MNNEEYDENNNNDVGGEEYYDNYNFEPIWVRALYDYDAADDKEISFKENDVICITQDFEDGWWNGDLNGNVGRVPANYFEYLNQDQTGDYQQDNYDDAQDQQQQQQYYEGEDGQLYYTGEDGQQYYYDGGQDQQQQQQYDGGDYDQQNQQEGYGDDGDDEEGGSGGGGVKKIDEARKELLRQKREVYKKEMKDLQDNLKNQNDCKDRLGTGVESLEKKRDELEDRIRLLKLLKFINLEIIKTEIDIDVDSDSSTTSRQTGIAITQDLKSIRTLLGIKSSTSSSSTSAVDAPKKQFDLKLEDIEKKVINNLNLLDSCDNLKKSLLLSLQLFQTTYLNGNGIPPPSPTRIKSIPTNSTNIQQQPQQPQQQPLPPPQTQQQPPLPPSSSSSSSSNTNTSNNFYVSTSSTPSNAFFSAPSTPLSDKDKRKSVKEAKKEEKKLEKELKKEEKKEEKKLEKKVSK
ncbi:hypothetical protein ACTFIR_012758 [Dictyostelium discoideum]